MQKKPMLCQKRPVRLPEQLIRLPQAVVRLPKVFERRSTVKKWRYCFFEVRFGLWVSEVAV
jgi:hypothetical protein